MGAICEICGDDCPSSELEEFPPVYICHSCFCQMNEIKARLIKFEKNKIICIMENSGLTEIVFDQEIIRKSDKSTVAIPLNMSLKSIEINNGKRKIIIKNNDKINGKKKKVIIKNNDEINGRKKKANTSDSE